MKYLGSHLSVIYEFSSKFFLRCKHPFSKEKLTHVLILDLSSARNFVE